MRLCLLSLFVILLFASCNENKQTKVHDAAEQETFEKIYQLVWQDKFYGEEKTDTEKWDFEGMV